VSVYALIPARSGSKGIPKKNFKPLAGGPSAVERAIACAQAAGIREIEVSSDCDGGAFSWRHDPDVFVGQLYRPAALAQDDIPMIDVVKHALDQVPGEPEDIWLLLQPTQPLREPKHLIAAIELLRTSEVDSVVSVVALPRTHAPEFQCEIVEPDDTFAPQYLPGELRPICEFDSLGARPATRQSVRQTYIFDGTVYAFWRETVTRTGTIYGESTFPLIIPPSETCALDTPEDWIDAERRLRERAETQA
jgi:CMP-N,N'-diacetyllegionaminic acid synthase